MEDNIPFCFLEKGYERAWRTEMEQRSCPLTPQIYCEVRPDHLPLSYDLVSVVVLKNYWANLYLILYVASVGYGVVSN